MIIVWSGIALLLLLVAWEGYSSISFRSSFSNLEQASANRVVDEQGNNVGLMVADLPRHVRGFAVRGEETVNQQRKITYRWPSLFKQYKLALSVDNKERIHLVEVYSSQAE